MLLSPLAGILILSTGWRQSYLIIGSAALVLIVAAALTLRRDPAEMGQSAYGAVEAVTKKTEAPREPDSKVPLFSLRSASRTGQFWMLWLLLFSYGLCRSLMMVHLAAYATDLGFSLTVGANMLATMSGVALVGGISMGRVADYIGNRRAIRAGFGVLVASLVWLLVADEMWELYLFAAIFGFSWGALAVMRMPITAEIFGLGSLGAILGAVDFGTHAGSTFGPLLGGWLFDLTDEYGTAFLTSAAIAAIGLILALLLRPVKSRNIEES
jgi:MFS family permease